VSAQISERTPASLASSCFVSAWAP
jgi:hypothetical protein